MLLPLLKRRKQCGDWGIGFHPNPSGPSFRGENHVKWGEEVKTGRKREVKRWIFRYLGAWWNLITCIYTPWSLTWFTWKSVGKGDSFWKPSFSVSMLSFGGVGSMDSLQQLSFKIWSSSCLLPLVNTIEQKHQSNLFCPLLWQRCLPKKLVWTLFFLVLCYGQVSLQNERIFGAKKKRGTKRVFVPQVFYHQDLGGQKSTVFTPMSWSTLSLRTNSNFTPLGPHHF